MELQNTPQNRRTPRARRTLTMNLREQCIVFRTLRSKQAALESSRLASRRHGTDACTAVASTQGAGTPFARWIFVLVSTADILSRYHLAIIFQKFEMAERKRQADDCLEPLSHRQQR